MAEQFHDGELEVMGGREDVSYHGLMSVFRGGRRLTPQTRTEDDATCAGLIGRGPGQEVFQPLPAFLSGLLHVNFDSAASAQRRSESSDGCIR
jgi:hypothetical protein